jgi:nucleotide-binding universal stress UspA family protein
MYKKVLAPLDGSQFSECSLSHVKAIATGCQVPEVTLLIVVEEPSMSFEYMTSMTQADYNTKQYNEELAKNRQKAEKYIADVAAKLKKEGLDVKTEVVVCGYTKNVAECILDFARDSKVDLIVMSTHGRSGITRWAFGSVADRIIRSSTVPVLTVTPEGCRTWPTA